MSFLLILARSPPISLSIRSFEGSLDFLELEFSLSYLAVLCFFFGFSVFLL